MLNILNVTSGHKFYRVTQILPFRPGIFPVLV